MRQNIPSCSTANVGIPSGDGVAVVVASVVLVVVSDVIVVVSSVDVVVFVVVVVESGEIDVISVVISGGVAALKVVTFSFVGIDVVDVTTITSFARMKTKATIKNVIRLVETCHIPINANLTSIPVRNYKITIKLLTC